MFLAPLVGLALSETSLVVGTAAAATEVTGSELIGGVVAGAVVSTASNYLQDGIDQAAKKLLGENTVNGIKTSLSMASTEIQHAAESLYNQDVSALANSLRFGHGNSFGVEVHNNHSNGPLINQNGSLNTENLNNSTPTITIGTADQKTITDVVLKQINGLVLEKSPIKSITDSIITKDHLATTVSLNNYYQGSDNSVEETYKKIYEIYDGNFKITGESVRDGVTYFTWIDETGKAFEMKKNTSSFHLPSIHGNFAGPFSPNNALPIDYIDECSMLHDSAYDNNSYFDPISDLTLVSRIEHGIVSGKIRKDDMWLAKGMIKYFKNLAFTNLKLKGSLPPVLIEKPSEIITDDYYGNSHYDDAINNPEKFKYDQYEYYKELDNLFYENASVSSMITQNGMANKVAYRNILIAFDNIQVINE